MESKTMVDPEPSVGPHSDTLSEACWSTASSTVIDTRSEPARYNGKLANKIMSRAAQQGPVDPPPVMEPVESNNSSSNCNSSSALSAKLSSSSAKSASAASPSKYSKSAATASAAPSSVANSDIVDSRSSPQSKAGTSVAGSASVVSELTKTSKKSRSSKKSSKSTKSSSSKKKGRQSPTVSAASSTQASGSGGTNKSQRGGYSKASTSQAALVASSSSTSSNNKLAIVPVVLPPRSTDMVGMAIPGAAAVDPPSGASTSGSSSSTECTGPTLYDPPTTDGNSTYVSRESFVPITNTHEQLAVWNEGEEGTATLTTEDKSGFSGATEESEESRSYYSSDSDTSYGDEDDQSLNSAVERALAIRDDRRSEDRSSSSEEEEGDMSKDARALVQSDYHGGVESYDGEGQLVAHKEDNRYLAKAVDNHAAIVPIDSTIYEAYDHTFVTCPENLRFRFLYTFLKKNLDKKVMIFFSTTNSAKFHARLLERFHIPVMTMHGNQRREKFIGRFFKFSDLDEGILCATDGAGRDLDIPPSVDWVIQFEPPDDPSEYILRVARISCDSDRVGRSLLFLNPGEQGFLKYYHSASIPVSEFEIPRQLADVQSHIEHHVNESERLLRCARDAYGSYLLAYASHGFRDVYNVHDLNKSDVAAAFGLVGTLPGTDDMTMETDTLVSSYVNGIGGGELGGEAAKGSRKSGGSSKEKSWEKKEKTKTKSWMRGEKSWPHSQIKLHPKFKGSEVGY